MSGLVGKIRGHYLPCSFSISPAGGVAPFPASCSVGCLHSLRETDRCHANTHTHSHLLIVTVTFLHVHTQHTFADNYMSAFTQTHTRTHRKGLWHFRRNTQLSFFVAHTQAHTYRRTSTESDSWVPLHP